MQRIDSHQHFWQFDPVRDSWITDDMAVIQKDFLATDIKPVLEANGMDGCVLVQADQSEAQNDFMLQQAAGNDFIKGIVGWVDLQADNIEERLEYYKQFPIIKGFRHVLQGEAKRDLMLTPAFLNGIAALQQFGFTYDILIFPDQLQYIPEFVSQFPDQKFVIDHIAKPNIKERQIDAWAKDIGTVAKFENVYCKISGMVTEADWKNWQYHDFITYLHVVTEAFGTKRIMFGSDWPVCLVAASYEKMLEIVQRHFASFSKSDQDNFFGGNAIEFYGLGK